MEDTYNITIKCNSEDDRDEVLKMLDDGVLPWRESNGSDSNLDDLKIVRYHENSNVFFSEEYEGKSSTPLRKVT